EGCCTSYHFVETPSISPQMGSPRMRGLLLWRVEIECPPRRAPRVASLAFLAPRHHNREPPMTHPAAHPGPDSTVDRRASSGTAHGDAGRGHPARGRRAPGHAVSDHPLPLSYWQTESRSTGL